MYKTSNTFQQHSKVEVHTISLHALALTAQHTWCPYEYLRYIGIYFFCFYIISTTCIILTLLLEWFHVVVDSVYVIRLICVSGGLARNIRPRSDVGEFPSLSITCDSTGDNWLQDQDISAGRREENSWTACHCQSWSRRLTAGKCLSMFINVLCCCLVFWASSVL